VLPGVDLEGATTVAETLRRAVQDLKINHCESTVAEGVTVSIGVASTVPSIDEPRGQLFDAADQALYEAKEKGRNRVIARPVSG